MRSYNTFFTMKKPIFKHFAIYISLISGSNEVIYLRLEKSA